MKVNVEFECTPEEARRALGLPDMSKVNEIYVDTLAKTMQGGISFDQMQEYAKQIAPMGQFGLKLFQRFVESGATMASMGQAARRGDQPEGR